MTFIVALLAEVLVLVPQVTTPVEALTVAAPDVTSYLIEDAPNDRIAYIMRQSLIKYPTVFVNLQSNSSGSQAEVNSF